MEAGTLKIEAPAEKMKDWPLIGEKIYNFLYSASTNLEQAMIDYKEQITEVSKKALASIISSGITFLQIILSLIIAGFLMVSKSAQDLATNFIMRIAGDKGDEFLNISVSTVYQVVKGILGVAVIQTIIQAFGLFLCGVPFAGILTLLCLILSIVQIGPIIINIGVIAYLFSTGDSSTAVFWTVFFVLSGLSDNVLKPLLLGKGAIVPMLVIFLGVIGGFIMSGFIGLFVGPIIFSIGYRLFDAWMQDKKENAAPLAETQEGVEL
jgi:predicted PurR-regulated permease PerM